MNWFENRTREDNEGDDASTIDTNTTSPVKVKHPQSTLNLTATPRHSVIGIASGISKTHLCATVTARDLSSKDGEHRAPIDIVVALDVSESMNGDKLKLCKMSLELLIKSLLPGDRFGLVTFSCTAEVEIPLQELSREQKEDAIYLVQNLKVRKSTNISAAICLAAEVLQVESSPNAVRAIFLLTDGLAYGGITDCKELVNLTKARCGIEKDKSPFWETVRIMPQQREVRQEPPQDESNKYSPPISIHCFGYGSTHDSNMLQKISEATPGGSYYFVENHSDVLTAFGDALGGVFSVVAQNVVLTITVPEESRDLGVKIINVHHKNKIQRTDKSYAVTLGDFYAEESRDILVEVTLANPFITDVDYWITHAIVSLSYTETLSKDLVLGRPVLCDIARITGRAVSPANQHVKVQFLRVHVMQAIQDADALAAKGMLKEAWIRIDTMMDSIHMLTDDIRSDALVIQLLQDLTRCRNGLVSYQAYVSSGSHTLRNTLQSHGTQRCMDSLGTFRPNVYRGTMKTKTISKFANT